MLAIASSLFVMSCTDNQRVKNYGGSITINLDPGVKLINVTRKDDNEWRLTRPMHPGETAETYTFHEKSDYGINEGTITYVEHVK